MTNKELGLPKEEWNLFLDRNYPSSFVNSFTAGVGRKIHRTNNTQYCNYLKNNHAIIDGFSQNTANVMATVSAINIVDFNRSLAQ
jgi:hypothetical protein